MKLRKPISEKLYNTYLKTILMTNIVFSWFIGTTYSLPVLSLEICILFGVMLIATYYERKPNAQKIAFSIISICSITLSVILITIGIEYIINGNELLYLRYFALLPLVYFYWYGVKWKLLKL